MLIKSSTHSAWLPDPSESRYLCRSKTRLVVLPSGFVTPMRASAEPSEMKEAADCQSPPGRRIIWLAPVVRMAVTAA